VRSVTTVDGVALYIEEYGPDAGLTIVLVHGYALDHSFWRYQVHDLADLGRVVCFDQRAHGRSGRSAVVRCTIDQLGEDLALVLDEVAPTGPVVLIGHSMGGMTIMALAGRHPEWFGSRIVGVGLLQTSAGKMAEVTFGVPRLAGPLLTRLRPELLVGLSRAVPGRVWPGTGRNGSEPARIGGRLGHELAQALVQRFSFGSSAGLELVAAAEEMLAGTSLETLAAFAPTFLRHDKLRALGVLHDIPVLVVAADADLMTPTAHSEAIADALPHATLLLVHDAGHLAPMERPEVVTPALCELVRRALSARAT